MLKKFVCWWRRSMMSPTERYLMEAKDLADLERRMKVIATHHSFITSNHYYL